MKHRIVACCLVTWFALFACCSWYREPTCPVPVAGENLDTLIIEIDMLDRKFYDKVMWLYFVPEHGWWAGKQDESSEFYSLQYYKVRRANA